VINQVRAEELICNQCSISSQLLLSDFTGITVTVIVIVLFANGTECSKQHTNVNSVTVKFPEWLYCST